MSTRGRNRNAPRLAGVHAEVLTIFYEIGRALARGQGYGTVVRSVVKACTRLTGADAGSVLVLDPASGNLIHREAHGLSGAERTITFRPGEGVAGWVVKNERPARIDDVRTDRRFVEKAAQRRQIRSMLSVPVKLKRRVVGVLTVTSAKARAFTDDHTGLLSVLAAQVAIDLENARLQALASRDPLTGVANRRRFDETLSRHLADSKRTKLPVAVAILDLDHFKTVNDVYGHPTGDRVLKACVERWESAIRGHDLLARLGGEEFAVILPGADASRARDIAERLRTRLASSAFPVRRGSVDLAVTVSIGVAVNRSGQTAAGLLAQADAAVYRAKHEGRNRVVLAGCRAATPRRGERRRAERRSLDERRKQERRQASSRSAERARRPKAEAPASCRGRTALARQPKRESAAPSGRRSATVRITRPRSRSGRPRTRSCRSRSGRPRHRIRRPRALRSSRQSPRTRDS